MLSLSPASSAKGWRPGGLPEEKKKAPPAGDEALGGYGAPPVGKGGKGESRLKRPSVLISALTWKRLVAASAKKKKGSKKVTPKPASTGPDPLVQQRNRENLLRKGRDPPTAVALPSPWLCQCPQCPRLLPPASHRRGAALQPRRQDRVEESRRRHHPQPRRRRRRCLVARRGGSSCRRPQASCSAAWAISCVDAATASRS